ncbi:uncharacterized protein LOC129961632 [Argiope bruennichi]|uniref:uncharacterized protein LOC129961632 n=1 Tax=Argiope bruennichi TaxID=94029 RepID=UPI0024959115|nr:uncharacterized protein LOC129961632 [Argiope bruennichi]XP_055931125.1 uncharacterized protein LOC129961632 [Argiope bruennichi]XP_055931126.1 uncharacterized protein LOC129961632 [Argiope bruennichi]
MVKKKLYVKESISREQCSLAVGNIVKKLLPRIPVMGWNWIFIMLMHLQAGVSQLSNNNANLDELSSANPDHMGYGWPSRVTGATEIGECEGLGFQNASRNLCGFCTGGTTMLSDKYYLNCAGKCEGNKTSLDCNGDCKGSAYMDECSGECIGGNSPKTERDVESYRDCRGGCTSSGIQLFTDSCGVCHTGTSPFQDCTNRCYLPGQERFMAKLVCGRCVGGTTGISESEVLDPCGNCRSDGVECPCNGTGKADPCGVCNGGGVSCMRVIRFQPRALPVNTKAMVEIEGAFRGRTKNIKCIFKNEASNRTEFSGSGNGTHVKCSVQLKLGSYKVGVKLEVGDRPEEDFVEDSELLVYEPAEYTAMSPMKAVFDRGGSGSSQELIVTFTGSKVPRLPLICVITGDGWPADKRLAPSEANTLDTCIIPYPNSSVELNIAQSFNGIHTFKKTFPLRFYAPPPDMRKYYIAEDGHAVVIVFDRPVNLCNLDKCSLILNNETLIRLGEGAVCKWATKQQLIINVQNAIKGNPFRVTFLKGILKQDGQRFALPKNDSLTIDAWYPQRVNSAQIAISGPTTVPYCGTFTLTGHFSSPTGNADFDWTAYREDGQSLDSSLSNVLFGAKSSSLTLNASLLEVNMKYTFVLTAEQPVNEKYEAKHTISSVPYIGPLVTAYSDAITQSSVTVDQRITLRADISIPDCSTTDEHVHLLWSVNNPEVRFNFKIRDEYVYIIEPYSLPENSIVNFYANAFFGNRYNVTYSQVQLRVEPVKLRAAIKGVSKRVVGNKGGTLVLKGENLNKGLPLVYQWRCSDQDGPICYNYKENSTEPLLIPRRLQNKPKLEIPCTNLKPGKILTFELQVYNARNSFQSSSVASTVVVVEDKEIPLIVIEKVLADASRPVHRHPTTYAYDIPAGLPVAVHASITAVKSPIKSVKWDIKGFSSSYTFTAKNGMTVLLLEEGFLVGHGIYMIGLSACNTKGACGIANLTIHAVPGIALCKLDLQPYVEYEPVKIEVKDCSIPIGRQPVTYQLYLHSLSSAFPFSIPQTSSIFNMAGPPQQTSNGTQISVQVCDKYMLCTLFNGPVTAVTLTESRKEDREKLINKAALAVENRNLLPALSMFLTAASDPNAKMTKNEINHMMNAAANATDKRFIDANQLALIYSAMLPLLRRKEENIKLKALDIMKRATTLAFAHNEKIPSSVLALGHSNTAEALQSCDSDSEVSRRVKEVLDVFIEKISAVIPLGSKVQLASKYPGYPSTLVFRQLLDNTPIYLKAKSNSGLMEGSVRFEDAVRERLRNRKCRKKTTDCEGLVVALTLYPSQTPYPNKPKRTSPVMEVTLRKPEDGTPISISNVPNAIKLALSHKGNNTEAQEKGILYRCSFWDESLKEWSDVGIVTYGVDGDVMRCWSSHLTAFAVIETYGGLSTGAIVGIIVTVLMGIFIIMMFAFFFFRKKQAANARVSHETLPKRDKLQSSNGSVVKVKAVTP